MKLKLSITGMRLFAIASALAVMTPEPVKAETVFVGALSSSPRGLLAGTSGSLTIRTLGIWKDASDSGDTRIEVSLPSIFQVGVAVAPNVSSRIFSSQFIENIQGLGNNIPLTTDGDYICGTVAFDIDPSTGDLYAIMGRNSSYSTSCNTSNRWLTRYNPDKGLFTWIANLGRVNSMEFLGDGTLLTVSASNGPGGRGHIYEVNKSTGAMTARVNPSVSDHFRDIVYNPGDGMLYATERCNLIRIDPSDWSYTTETVNDLCSVRRVTAGLLADNHIMVQVSSSLYEIEIDPADGSVVSSTYRSSVSSSHPRFPMIASLTAAASVSRVCTISEGENDLVTCSFGNIGYNASLSVPIPVTYDIPANTPPGSYEGMIRWFRGETLLASAPLNYEVKADDIAVAVSPASGSYDIDDTFTVSVDATATAEGGKDVNDVDLHITLPSNLKATSVSGPGTCGLTRTGARCFGFSVALLDTETIDVNVKATGNGNAKVVAALAQSDAIPGNDVAIANFVIGDSADLVASGTKGGSGAVGQAVDLSVSVTNKGPEVASNAVLRLPGNAGFDLGSATADVGSCALSNGDLLCSFGNLAVDDVATVSLKVTPQRVGMPVLTAQASSETFDINAVNNAYSFAVSVPAKPLTVALGEASPRNSSGSIRSVLQLAVTPDASAGQGVRLTSLGGAMTIKTEGLGLKATVLVYADLDANGLVDEKDSYVGAGSLSAVDGTFQVDFSGGISAPTAKTSHFVLAVREGEADKVATAPILPTSNTWAAMGLAGALPFAFAGFAFKRHRTLAAVFGLALGLTACSEELKDLLSSAKVTATVTSISATLMDDHNASVDVSGLPISGPTVTLSR